MARSLPRVRRHRSSTGPVNLKVAPNECCLGRSPYIVVNPDLGRLDRDKDYSLSPCSRLRIWPRETGSAVPFRVSPLILHTQAESSIINPVPTHTGSSPSFRFGIKHFRTDDVHRQESAGTGPVVLLKVARVLFVSRLRSIWASTC